MDNSQKQDLKNASTLYQKILDLLSFLLLAGMFVFLLVYWDRIPDKIPTHYGFSGAADGFGPKGTLLLLPVIGVLLYLLLVFVSKFPSLWNLPVKLTPFNKIWVYANVKSLLSTMKLLIMIVYAQLTVCSATEKNVGFFPLFVIAEVFAVLFYFIRRMKKIPPENPEDYDCF